MVTIAPGREQHKMPVHELADEYRPVQLTMIPGGVAAR
jgi:hypothetical protein